MYKKLIMTIALLTISLNAFAAITVNEFLDVSESNNKVAEVASQAYIKGIEDGIMIILIKQKVGYEIEVANMKQWMSPVGLIEIIKVLKSNDSKFGDEKIDSAVVQALKEYGDIKLSINRNKFLDALKKYGKNNEK